MQFIVQTFSWHTTTMKYIILSEFLVPGIHLILSKLSACKYINVLLNLP